MNYITPDFGTVTLSTKMLSKQCYRATIKDELGQVILMSIDTYRNRDLTSSIALSARDAAAILCRELMHGRLAFQFHEADSYHHISLIGIATKGQGKWICGDKTLDSESVKGLIRKGWITITKSTRNRFGQVPVEVRPSLARMLILKDQL